jgi:hypothetical protein
MGIYFNPSFYSECTSNFSYNNLLNHVINP